MASRWGLLAAVFAASTLAATAGAQTSEDEDAPEQDRTPKQRELPKGVPGPDVLKKRLENLRVPVKGANTTTGRETPGAVTATPVATSQAASTPAPAPTATQTSTLVQTNPNPQNLKATPWNAKVSLNTDDGDLENLIKEISRLTARNFIYDKKDVRNQKVTILMPTKVTMGEAYQAFQTTLEGAGLTIYNSGPNVYRIIPRRDAPQKPLDTDAGAGVPWNDSFVTRIIRLQNIEVGQIQGILQQLSSKDGAQVQAFAPTNSLILTDTANNIRRLLKIIDELDRSGGEENIEVIQIMNADVQDVADKIQQLFGAAGGQPGQPGVARTGAPAVRRPVKAGQPITPDHSDGAAGESAPLVSKVIPDARTSQIIVVANDRALLALQDFLAKIDKPIETGGSIHVYYLENADAEELATVLANLAQGVAGQGGAGGRRGSTPQPGGIQQPGQPGQSGQTAVLEGDVRITADKATNALVITASKSDYQSLVNVIKKLDIRRQQVYVEAVIMEMTVSKARDLGLSFVGGAPVGNDAGAFGGLNAGNVIALDPSRLATGFALGLIGPEGTTISVPNPTGGTTEVAIPAFGVILNAIQTDSDINVLSRPNILAKENEEAEIVIATSIAVPGNVTISQSGLQNISVTREDVGITLKVTPKINESDTVSLQLFQEVKDIVKEQTIGSQRLVDTGKRSAKTNVVVKNGETIVIGGLLSDTDRRNESKIPLLGDIPFLGFLFRSSNRSAVKQNLCIFLTPTIIKDESDMKRIYERRIREREEFLRLYGNRMRRAEAKRRMTLFERYYGAEDKPKEEAAAPIVVPIKSAEPMESKEPEPKPEEVKEEPKPADDTDTKPETTDESTPPAPESESEGGTP